MNADATGGTGPGRRYTSNVDLRDGPSDMEVDKCNDKCSNENLLESMSRLEALAWLAGHDSAVANVTEPLQKLESFANGIIDLSEWFCSPDSLLAKEVIAHGMHAERLNTEN